MVKLVFVFLVNMDQCRLLLTLSTVYMLSTVIATVDLK